MKNALVISGNMDSADKICDMLMECGFQSAEKAADFSAANRLFSEKAYELTVVNMPASNIMYGCRETIEFSENQLCQVIVIVKDSCYDKAVSAFSPKGIYAIAKPLNSRIFSGAVKLIQTAADRMSFLYNENARLENKIDEIKVINRAKYILMETLEMSEAQAHRYIEKQAMDLRKTKYSIAEDVLNTYENRINERMFQE